ncbi:hypothetical protein JJ691_22280 [Kutzneria sp. CA-103260]|nr:hypothetical protein JJ691_22280 [Kutzneria sp. CA-103260]
MDQRRWPRDQPRRNCPQFLTHPNQLLGCLGELDPFHGVAVDVALVVSQPVEELLEHLVLVDGGGGGAGLDHPPRRTESSAHDAMRDCSTTINQPSKAPVHSRCQHFRPGQASAPVDPISIPDDFTAADQTEWDAAAAADPRLARAATEAGTQIPQFLAGVPALVGVYRHGQTVTRALITAGSGSTRTRRGQPTMRARARATPDELAAVGRTRRGIPRAPVPPRPISGRAAHVGEAGGRWSKVRTKVRDLSMGGQDAAASAE